MRTILFTLSFIMAATAALPSTPVKFSGKLLKDTRPAKGYEVYSAGSTTQQIQSLPRMKPMSEPEGETAEVSFTVKYDEETFFPDGLYIVRTDLEQPQTATIPLFVQDFDPETEEVTSEYIHETSAPLPIGEYTIFGIFVEEYTPYVCSTHSLKIESATDITIDVSDATIESQFLPLTHSGLNFNDAAASQNGEPFYDAYLTLAFKGNLLTSIWNGYINPSVRLSPECEVNTYYAGFYSDNNGKDYIALGPANANIPELTIEVSDYTMLHTEGTSTSFRPNENSYLTDQKYFNCMGYRFGMPTPAMTTPQGVSIGSSADDKWGEKSSDNYLACKVADSNFSVAALVDCPEYRMTMMQSPYRYCPVFGIVPPILTNAEGKIYGGWRPIGHVALDPFAQTNLVFTSERIGHSLNYPEVNKNFAPSFENGSSFQFGNNTPIVQMSTPLPTSLTINFIGRNQELFNADNLASDISILLDGNEVIEEYGETGCPDISGAGAAITQNPGKVEINLTCSNHLIDNSIQATTSMTMQWNAAGEPTPPTMQMLQLRDTKDNITDRFDTPSEGNLNFAAGCFYYDMEADRYACRLPEQVKLEIAPFNSDEFTEISVTEMPEKYFMPGYGGFYSAPLESLTGESSNGWWTARITLRDGDAVQTQTIAPAFFIASTVSAKQIEADGIKVNGNSIEAPEGSIVYDTFGRIRGLSNLDKGIYYIRTTKAIHKVLVK